MSRRRQSTARIVGTLLLSFLCASVTNAAPVEEAGGGQRKLSHVGGDLEVLDIPLKMAEPGSWEDRLSLLPEVVQENLMADMEYWRKKAPLPMSSIDALQQHCLKKVHFAPDTVKRILIYNSMVYFPDRGNIQQQGCPNPCSKFMASLIDALSTSMKRRKVFLPNALLILDTNDNAMRWCSPQRNCPAPLFSLQKWINGSDDYDTNILIPQFLHIPKAMYYYPWDKKIQKGFFRGAPQCQGYIPRFEHSCERVYLTWRSMSDKSDVLDVHITVSPWSRGKNEKGEAIPHPLIPQDIEAFDETPMREHAKYAYLLALEGITASSRLAELLSINSVVLKSTSPYHEYYYRSLKPNVHYKQFWNTSRDDIFDVLKDLREQSASDPTELHKIVQRAQQFSLRATHFRPRLLYWKAALTEYRSLYPDMDNHIEKLVAELRAKGFNFEGYINRLDSDE